MTLKDKQSSTPLKLDKNSEKLNHLKKWRFEMAKTEKRLPFFIISNAKLNQLASTKLSTYEELINSQILSIKELQKYGQSILLIINEKTPNISNSISTYHELSKIKYISKKEFNELLKDESIKEEVRIKNNKEYIDNTINTHRSYLENLLKESDPNITLDLNQMKVVLDDEDYTLVVAGAGSGKTTTIAAKIKYLVGQKKINPKDILVVSYTNKAVNELRQRVNKELNIPTEIYTFHKVGLNILSQFKTSSKLKVVHDGLMFNLIKEYLSKHIKDDPILLKELILFFGYYIEAPPPSEIEQHKLYKQKTDYSTLKSDIKEINRSLIEKKTKKRTSIKNEVLRSMEEVQIANFLFLNGIDYQYEAPYPFFIEGSKKLYTPDFTIKVQDKVIYLEHFGITESGTNSHYTFYELEHYKKAIQDKINLHGSHGTDLIYTYSSYDDEVPMLKHLEDLLISKGIVLKPKSPESIHDILVKEDHSKYFTKLIFLLMRFINNFKINGYNELDFDRLMRKTTNVRVHSFLKLCKPIYLFYQSKLSEMQATDFQDMINDSSEYLKNAKKEDLNRIYKYIIVDEYQDISRQRFKLTKHLSDLTGAKVMAVGDDWQSIYAFAGSQIKLFTDFEKEMGYANYLTIDYTYRNAQEIIDVAGSFIQKNQSQLKKSLKSHKSIKKPFVLFAYDDRFLKNERRGIRGVIASKAEKLDEIIGKIIQVDGMKSSILILIRYNFEAEQLTKYSDLFYFSNDRLKSKNYPNANIEVMTIHKSKGLGFDNVILLNGSDGTFGFPSQIEIDPILSLVIYDDKSVEYAEERRLFYVALTRTKNRVFIMYPTSKPSEFVRELVEDYEDVTLHGKIDPKQTNRKLTHCPLCGYPLQLKDNKAYGLKLYMCTNEVELCGFMSNNLKGGIQSIEKCDQCLDGFMIIKDARKSNQVFLGCTNYKLDKKGCNNIKEL